MRWTADAGDARRVELERRFQLIDGERREGTTWQYQLADTTTANIRAIVQHELVEDTADLDRSRFRAEAAQERSRRILSYSAAAGGMGAALLLMLAAALRQPPLLHVPTTASIAAAFTARAPQTPPHAAPRLAARSSFNWRTTATVVAAGALAIVAMSSLAGSSLASAATALLLVYICGYVVGSLLIDRVDQEAAGSWAVIRTAAGLLLTTIGFLLSLALSLPWFLFPGVLVAAAAGLRGRTALSWPRIAIDVGWDGAATGVVVGVILLPIVITALYMAPGAFPPVFYNVDTAYFLEKVHTLVAADGYPPGSLSNLGGLRTYHFGTHAMAALLARGSGLLPHHSLFLIVLPLLTAGLAAAAVAAARYVSPSLPRIVAVPVLLVSVPPLSSTFWGEIGPPLWAAMTSSRVSIGDIIGTYQPWGILSNEGQNIGGDFLILATLAGIAAAPVRGWRIVAFLVGTGMLVKTSTGIALLAGFVLSEAWRASAARRIALSPQLLVTGLVFAATYLVFWALPPVEPDFRVELFPFYHLRYIAFARGSLVGLVADGFWLLLPILIVAAARLRDPARGSALILCLGIAPLLVVNATRMMDMRPGMSGPDDDWLQVLHPVPFFLHAFALSLASRRWDRLGRRWRAAFMLAIALVTVPVAASAAHYSRLLLEDPARGNDFVDNRPLADALAVIPTRDTTVVTNDLRYPAGHFARDNRQMQIPALFGHQAFAVNYVYEVYAFSGERRELQTLLQAPEWSAAVEDAARRHRWTHLLIRKDAAHPDPIPLERIFESDLYSVFRFP